MACVWLEMASGARSAPSKTKLVMTRTLTLLDLIDNMIIDLFQVQAPQTRILGADLAIRVSIVFPSSVHDLGRGHNAPEPNHLLDLPNENQTLRRE